jgi:hypothetical protein
MNRSLKGMMAVLGLVLLVGAAAAVSVSADAGSAGTISGCQGMPGHAQVVRLVEKNSTDWSIVRGAFGTAMFQQGRFVFKGHRLDPRRNNNTVSKFVFNGHRLTPGVNYSLISYAEPWPGTGSIVLGNGTATGQGNVHIRGNAVQLVCNNYTGYTTGDYRAGNGTKIWLVPASDIDAATGTFSAWNPDQYLFEKKLINTRCIAPS